MHNTKSNHLSISAADRAALQSDRLAKFQRKRHLIAPALFVQFGALSLIQGIESRFFDIRVFHIL
jgi:hypothetical protein